jgi:hypothetical protein
VSPDRAKIIRVTRSERSPLLMIQQVTPRTRTARANAAASKGRPSPARRAADSIPAAARLAYFNVLFTAADLPDPHQILW